MVKNTLKNSLWLLFIIFFCSLAVNKVKSNNGCKKKTSRSIESELERVRRKKNLVNRNLNRILSKLNFSEVVRRLCNQCLQLF